MIPYMRISKSKFWGWVFSALGLGLVIGAVVMLVLGNGQQTRQINAVKQQMAQQASQAKTAQDVLAAKLTSSEASLAVVTTKYDSLVAEQKKAADSQTTPSTSTDALEVVSRTVSPKSVAASDTITLTAKVKGGPGQVTMRIIANSGSYDKTFTLKKSSTSDGVETWARSVNAPSKNGTYRYFATATGNGNSVTMSNASPSTFVVE
jgi:uncharacterized membrane-anchored protein YhcB (DUF1043 family)